MNAYIADILAQPQALSATLDGLRNTPSDLRPLAAQLRGGSYARIVLTGMGSSLTALYPLWYRLIAAGYAPILVETSELLYDAAALLNDSTLAIVVSQSGRSAEVARLLEQTHGAVMLAVTNSAESPLAQAASTVVLTAAGAEHSVSCKTYVCTLAALEILGDRLLGQENDQGWNALWAGVEQTATYLQHWETKASELAAMMDGGLIFCGRGPSLAAAYYSALILKEAAKVHAEGISSAQFRHGPLELASTGARVLVYQGLPNVAALNTRLMQDVQRGGGCGLLVGSASETAALRLPEAHPRALPLLEALPAQLLSVGLAWRQGLEPGQFVIGSKVTLGE